MKRNAKTHQQAISIVLDLNKEGLTHHEISKEMMLAGYPSARGGSKWYYSTVQRILDAHARKRKRTPNTRAPDPQTVRQADRRRGHKRMTRKGWESLPEPVQEVIIERIMEAMGQ